MSDQCENCSVKGDLERCQATVCGHRETWYAKQMQAELKAARAEITIQAAMIEAMVAYFNPCPIEACIYDCKDRPSCILTYFREQAEKEGKGK